MEQKNNGKSIASLVLGIVSVVSCFFGVVAIVGVATGIVGLILAINAKKEDGKATGMTTAGLVLSIIGLAVSAIIFISCVACAGCYSAAVNSAIEGLDGLHY